jgi:uncharacterized protein YdbL (DUF1318 family)
MKHLAKLVLISLIATVTVALADTQDEIKERRKARKDQIDLLIKQNEASENEQGYLTPAKDLEAEKEALVKAENADRKSGYEAIAKRTGTSLEKVEKDAAAFIKQRAQESKK